MQPHSTNPDNTFYLGLCMAGAVSAGAYTAGVMDYLIEALQEWQARKNKNEPGTPSHNVVIPVIGGASAGGMTAIITAAALANGIKPVYPGADVMAAHPENKLYHSWVDLTDQDMFPHLLDTGDIHGNGIVSLLNSSFIDDVAKTALQTGQQGPERPAFIDPEMKIFTTLTNLEGFGYNIGFNTNTPADKYYMCIHNDYACFKLNGVDKPEDGWIHLDFQQNINTDIARDAAMATGAFPLGLQSRKVKRACLNVNNIPWCVNITKPFPITQEPWETLNVDGGIINNEPFEKVRDILKEKTSQPEYDDYQDPNKARSIVVMIDPFPSSKPKPFKADTGLFKVMGATFSAMLSQMRAKPQVLHEAMDPKMFGQLLIAPSRKRTAPDGTTEDIAGDMAIACGALGGFSGFLNKEFRVHDYFLGRFNCEIFLRNYFTIPASALQNNTIFKNGYAGIDMTPFRAKDGSIQIIPIFAPPAGSFPIPTFSNGSNWPVLQEKDIDRFQPMVKQRVQALLIKAVNISGLNKFLLWIGAKVVLNRTISNFVLKTIKASLEEHKLLNK